jgi:hypothetical protein
VKRASCQTRVMAVLAGKTIASATSIDGNDLDHLTVIVVAAGIKSNVSIETVPVGTTGAAKKRRDTITVMPLLMLTQLHRRCFRLRMSLTSTFLSMSTLMKNSGVRNKRENASWSKSNKDTTR